MPSGSRYSPVSAGSAQRQGPGDTSLVSRRRLLSRGLLAGVLAMAGGSPLASCASASGSAARKGQASLGALSYRLSWVKNVEFAGAYIADSRGYYRSAGFSSVNLLSGGPSATPMEADVATGKALVAVSSPDITGAAIANGAPLKIIGAQYQKSPFAVMSMADKPIRTPQEMYGKKIGVQVGNEQVWNAFLRAARLDPSRIDKVPVQFDPLPLTQGTVDGWFSFITNEPNELRSKGYAVTTFLLADYGYRLVSSTYLAHTDTIKNKRGMLRAFLLAEIRGWKDNIAAPTLGAQLAVDVYGKGLGLSMHEQLLESMTENGLILTPDTRENGLFTLTQNLIEQNMVILRAGGLSLRADQLFDLSVLQEVYRQHADLI